MEEPRLPPGYRMDRSDPDVWTLRRSEGWVVAYWVRPVELETALEQQKRLSELVDASQLVVKTAAIEEAIEEWPASQLRRAQPAHSAIILASEEGLSLSRATLMPPS